MKAMLAGLFFTAALAIRAAAQGTFNYVSDERSITGYFQGEPIQEQVPSAPFADFNGSVFSSNSPTEFFSGTQNSTLGATQIIVSTLMTMQIATPTAPASAYTDVDVDFTVATPVMVSLTYDHFQYSGFHYNGLLPGFGVTGTDPNWEATIEGIPTRTNGMLLPGYTYTLREQMDGTVYPGTTQPVNGMEQLNVTLSIVPAPEPSAIALLAAGLVLLGCRLLRRRIQRL